MDIKILKYEGNLRETRVLNDNLVLEKVKCKGRINGLNGIILSICDLTNNTRYEIMPRRDKYKLVDIINASYKSNYIYFTVVDLGKESSDKLFDVELVRYNFVTNTTESIVVFKEEIFKFGNEKNLKIFVLNENYLLFQFEFLRANHSNTYSGYFDFELKLYNIKDKTWCEVQDENLAKNGIEAMYPVSESHSVMKIGYSLLKDNIKNELNIDECSFESISFFNVGQLISDILINKTDIIIDCIDRVCFSKTFAYLKKIKNYIIYSRIDFETKDEEIFFVDVDSHDKSTCINKNVIRETDLADVYIIDGNPFVLLNKDGKVEFLNVKLGKVTIEFNTDDEFYDVVNDTFIFKGVKEATLFRTSKSYFKVYSYPQQTLLLQENSELSECLANENDEIYFYVK